MYNYTTKFFGINNKITPLRFVLPSDIKLLEECKEELHRRLRAYHSWRDANTGQSSEENERIPQQALAQTSESN